MSRIIFAVLFLLVSSNSGAEESQPIGRSADGKTVYRDQAGNVTVGEDQSLADLPGVAVGCCLRIRTFVTAFTSMYSESESFPDLAPRFTLGLGGGFDLLGQKWGSGLDVKLGYEVNWESVSLGLRIKLIREFSHGPHSMGVIVGPALWLDYNPNPYTEIDMPALSQISLGVSLGYYLVWNNHLRFEFSVFIGPHWRARGGPVTVNAAYGPLTGVGYQIL